MLLELERVAVENSVKSKFVSWALNVPYRVEKFRPKKVILTVPGAETAPRSVPGTPEALV